MLTKIFTTVKKASAETSTTHGKAMRARCATAEGANILASELKSALNKSTAGSERAYLLTQQFNEAEKAANCALLKADLADRIPQAMERTIETAEIVIKKAKQEEAVLQKQAQGFCTKLDKSTAQLQQLKDEKSRIFNAAKSKVQAAEEALEAARTSDELDSLADVSAALAAARQAERDMQKTQEAQAIRIETLQSMVAQQAADLSVVQNRLQTIQATGETAQGAVLAIAYDRAILEAVMAYVRLKNSPHQTQTGAYGNPEFRFLNGEHTPLHFEKNSPCTFSGWRVQAIEQASMEPDWRVFDVDPSTLDATTDKDAAPSDQTESVEVSTATPPKFYLERWAR